MPEYLSEKANNRRKAVRRNSQFAVEYLLGHPAASNEDVIKATGCGARSVSRARAMLVATGQLQKSYFDRQHRPTGPIQDAAVAPTEPPDELLRVEPPRDPSALEKALREDHGPALTVEQMKQRYSAIARYGARSGEFTLEIQAMQALGRLDSQTGDKNRLGPPAPHTRADRRDRVIPILQAAGPSIVAESVVIGYSNTEYTSFLNELGRFMARKAEDGTRNAENPPTGGAEGPLEGPIPAETVVAGEVGPRGSDDRGETDPTGAGTGGVADGGGTTGTEGG